MDERQGFVKDGKVRVELLVQYSSEWNAWNSIVSTIFSVIHTFPIPACCVSLIAEVRLLLVESPRFAGASAFRQLVKLARSRCLLSWLSLPW
jgi:hypothetical protein